MKVWIINTTLFAGFFTFLTTTDWIAFIIYLVTEDEVKEFQQQFGKEGKQAQAAALAAQKK